MMLAVLAVGCSNEDFDTPPVNEQEAVIITAGSALSADVEMGTRATIENTWGENDHIGVTMLSSELPSSVVSEYENRDYKIIDMTGETATFVSNPESSKMYYPIDGSNVTFKAYYPYKSSIADQKYPVNVSGQGDIAALDLMTAEHVNKEGELNVNNKNNPEAHLLFYHRLTLATFNLTSEEPISLNGSTLKVKGMNTRGEYELMEDILTVDDTSEANIEIPVSSNSGQAILLPRVAGKGVTFEVTTTNGGVYTAFMSDTLELKGGYKYTFNLTLKTTPAEISATIEPWLGGPTSSMNVVKLVTDLGKNENVKDNAQIQLYLKDTKNPDGTDISDPEFALKNTYTYSETSDIWTPTTPLYWENIYGDPVEFRGTSIWESKLHETQMDDILISEDVSVDPYKGVNLDMKHAGSKISITLESTDDTFSADDLKDAIVSLPDYLNKGTLNPTTGAFEIDNSSRGDISPAGDEMVAIFPPQTIDAGDVIARVTINGTEYDVKAESSGFTYESGTHYQLILNVQKTDLKISTQIVPWTTVDLGTREVTIGTANLGENSGDLKTGDKLYLFTGDDAGRAPAGGGYFEYTGSGWVHKNASGEEPLYWENIPNTGSIYASITREEITEGLNQSKDYITATPVINHGGIGNTAIDFDMSHKVAQVQIKLTSDVYNEADLRNAEITLPGYMTGGTLDNGIYKPGSTSGDIKLANPDNEDVITSAYLQPQTIVSPKTLVKVIINNREYLLTHTVTYAEGQITYLNIDIKASEALVSVTVKPWVNQEPVDIRFFFTESETSVGVFQDNDRIKFYKMNNLEPRGVTDDKNEATYTTSGTTASLTDWAKEWYRDDFQTGDQIVGVFPATASDLVSGGSTFNWTCPGDNTGTVVTNNHQHDILVSRLSGDSSTGTVMDGSANVALDFIHVLSKITVEIYAEEGFTKAELEAAANAATLYPELKGFVLEGTINVSNATATAGSTIVSSFRPTKLGTNPVKAAASYEALIMPQTITAPSIIDVQFDGQTYEALFNSAGNSVATTFEAGKNHVFKIYLKKTGILLSTTVEDWVPGTGGSITIQ